MVATACCSLQPSFPIGLRFENLTAHPCDNSGHICLADVLGGWPKQEPAIRVRSQDRTKYDAHSREEDARGEDNIHGHCSQLQRRKCMPPCRRSISVMGHSRPGCQRSFNGPKALRPDTEQADTLRFARSVRKVVPQCFKNGLCGKRFLYEGRISRELALFWRSRSGCDDHFYVRPPLGDLPGQFKAVKIAACLHVREE